MKIDFVVDGRAGVFERSNVTGRAVLRLGEETVTLQSPWDPRTHFALSTTKTWRVRLGGHDVVVTKQRPQTFGGFREADFAIAVDGEEVTAARGR